MMISRVKPEGNRSDKYSINLYRFLKDNQDCDRVFVSRCNRLTGAPVNFDFSDPCAADIYIGRMDEKWFIGKCLSSILCGGSGYKRAFAYMPNSNIVKSLEDVTDWFYTHYQRQGRALWDASGTMSMIDDGGRWTCVGNTRRCNWSGRWYYSEVEKRQKTNRVKVWRVARLNSPWASTPSQSG